MIVHKTKPETLLLPPGTWYAVVDRIAPGEVHAIFLDPEGARRHVRHFEHGVMTVVEVVVP